MATRSDHCRVLSKKHAVVKGKSINVKKFIDSYTEDLGRGQLLQRKRKLDACFNEFEKIQDEIDEAADDIDIVIEGRNAFEDEYILSKKKIDTLINNTEMQTRDSAGNNTTISDASLHLNTALLNTNQYDINVPRLELPKFSSSYETWPIFTDAFKSAVHNDSGFTPAQNLIYLRSCLTEKAVNKIRSLETTNANYTVVWNQFERYYNDPNSYINKRLQAIIELPGCYKPSASDIKELHTR